MKLFFYFLAFILTCNTHAESLETTKDVPTSVPMAPRRIIQVGVYHEYLSPQTRALYKPSSPGILLSFQHILGKIWRGSLEVRWSHWKTLNEPEYFMPLGLYSKISVQPNLTLSGLTFSPYLTAGLGYTLFFHGKSYFNLRTQEQIGDFSVIAGGGLQIVVVKSFGINVGFDAWRGFQPTPQYFVSALSLGLVKQF